MLENILDLAQIEEPQAPRTHGGRKRLLHPYETNADFWLEVPTKIQDRCVVLITEYRPIVSAVTCPRSTPIGTRQLQHNHHFFVASVLEESSNRHMASQDDCITCQEIVKAA